MEESALEKAEAEDESTEIAELQAEIGRIALPENAAAAVMKKKLLETLELTPPVLVLPANLLVMVFSLNRNAYHELLSIHLPKIIEYLRPQGPSLLLAYSLLSLSRAWRFYNSLEARSELILEAIQIFKQLRGKNRLGRTYLDLAVVFKDAKHNYDALYILKLSEQESEKDRDKGALSAAWYHRAVICRTLNQNIEALYFLNKAEQVLKNKEEYKIWLPQIISERIPNNIVIKRYDDARTDINRMLDIQGAYFLTYFYLGEIEHLSGNEANALDNYQSSALLLSIDVLQNQSDRFQIITRTRYDFVYKRGLECAVKLDNPLVTFSLLQLSKTEGLDFLISTIYTPADKTSHIEPDQVTIERLQEKAWQALHNKDQLLLDEVQSQADWLIAEKDFQSYSAGVNFDEHIDLAQIASRLQSAIPTNTLLIEFFSLNDEFWMIMVNSESASAMCCFKYVRHQYTSDVLYSRKERAIFN